MSSKASKSKKSKSTPIIVKKTDGILQSGRGLKDITKQRLIEVLQTIGAGWQGFCI
jgi:hypothetical protein